MLTREVHTSMRGRAMEVTVFPFSFREALRHAGSLPEKEWESLPKAARSSLEKAFRTYLHEGGFPDAQQLDVRDRRPLLQGYVDVAVLRDIIERHGISNPVALRWLQRHLQGNPAAPFSIQNFYDALKSQGLPVSKDSLHAFLAYFEDAFLIRTTSLFTASERQRMVNPRKAYPIDPGLIPIYERGGRDNLGQEERGEGKKVVRGQRRRDGDRPSPDRAEPEISLTPDPCPLTPSPPPGGRTAVVPLRALSYLT